MIKFSSFSKYIEIIIFKIVYSISTALSHRTKQGYYVKYKIQIRVDNLFLLLCIAWHQLQVLHMADKYTNTERHPKPELFP